MSVSPFQRMRQGTPEESWNMTGWEKVIPSFEVQLSSGCSHGGDPWEKLFFTKKSSNRKSWKKTFISVFLLRMILRQRDSFSSIAIPSGESLRLSTN